MPKTKNKKRSPGYSRNKGNAYERKIVKELKELKQINLLINKKFCIFT